ncbi:putative membrane protein [Thermoplasmatales archaeon SCGC AB-540-F20]|nr:putative membrane protein [Thermoplasmatales archaeon SCGC AB-540-F20]
MKILILNVDRDDDFGRKAKVKSPIIGIQDNLDAANKLGRADPEDSDLNAIFLAISTYDGLKKEGKDVEVATLCGDISVGVKSDQKINDQLKTVIKKTGAEEAILISDGAEDEYILPIVQSRLKIISIQRVSVKQSKELEDTYYKIIKLLDDDKVKKQFILPIALVLIVWAIFAILNMAASGFGAIVFTLGAYLLIRVFNWEKNIAFMFSEMKSGLLTGKLSFYTYITAIVIIAISTFYAFNNTKFNSELLWAIPVLSFLKDITWGIVSAGLVATFGRVTDLYVRKNKVNWSYWIVPFSLFAFGFTAYAISKSLYYSLLNDFSITPFQTFEFIGYLSVGILIAFIGAVSYHYIRDIYITEEHEIDIEEQTTKLLENAE